MQYVWTIRDRIHNGPRLNIREGHDRGKIVAAYTGFRDHIEAAAKGREVTARLNASAPG